MVASPAKVGQYICLYGVSVLAVHLLPGPWRHWSKGTTVDMWTFTHIFWGWLGAKMDQSFTQQMTLASLNEILEFLLRKYRPDLMWGGAEPGLNVPMDLVGNALGWQLGAQKRVLIPKKEVGQ